MIIITKILLVPSFCLLLMTSLLAQTVEISGTVQNILDKPVYGATIVLASDTTIRAITDSLGNFLLKGEGTAARTELRHNLQPAIHLQGRRIRLIATQSTSAKVTLYAISGRKISGYSFEIPGPGTHLFTIPDDNHGTGCHVIHVDFAGKHTVFGYIPLFAANQVSFTHDKSSRSHSQITARATQVVDDSLLVRVKGYRPLNHPISSYVQSNVELTVERISRLDNITRSCSGLMPSPLSGGQSGWGSRYWDCCKPHCSWPENTKHLSANCGTDGFSEIPCYKEINNGHATWLEGTKNGCDQDGVAYMCYRHVPFAICEKLAYGFAAVPAGDAACGKCFQLDFNGGAKHGEPKAAHGMVKGKIMIVMASNIGHDVSGGQFDLMIPGGGLGAFREGCKKQWNVDVSDENLVGKGLGGFISKCQDKHGWDADPEVLKECVRGMCDNLFGKDPALHDLWEGCIWYVDWMHAVDNPTFTYKEVPCPQELINLYYSSEHPKP